MQDDNDADSFAAPYQPPHRSRLGIGPSGLLCVVAFVAVCYGYDDYYWLTRPDALLETPFDDLVRLFYRIDLAANATVLVAVVLLATAYRVAAGILLAALAVPLVARGALHGFAGLVDLVLLVFVWSATALTLYFRWDRLR